MAVAPVMANEVVPLQLVSGDVPAVAVAVLGGLTFIVRSACTVVAPQLTGKSVVSLKVTVPV